MPPCRNQTQTFGHQISCILQSSCTHITQDRLLLSDEKRRRKCSQRPVRPRSRFRVPAAVMMRKRQTQHCIIVEGITWAQPHGSLEINSSRVRFAIPAPHQPAALQRACTICIRLDPALDHLESRVEVKPYPEKIESDKA